MKSCHVHFPMSKWSLISLCRKNVAIPGTWDVPVLKSTNLDASLAIPWHFGSVLHRCYELHHLSCPQYPGFLLEGICLRDLTADAIHPEHVRKLTRFSLCAALFWLWSPRTSLFSTSWSPWVPLAEFLEWGIPWPSQHWKPGGGSQWKHWAFAVKDPHDCCIH